jgi:hypothetical protein
MSPTIGLPPPTAETCLETPRKSRYLGGTVIAEEVHDLAEHRRRVASPDGYRPAWCLGCGHDRVHVHARVARHPRGEASLPPEVIVLRFRCASEECGATWRVLPLFLARHLWHTWKAVERAVAPAPDAGAEPRVLPIAARTRQRWKARLASPARTLVVLLAMSGGAALERVAQRVGLEGTRAELVDAYATAASTEPGERLSALGALVDRLERGIRLM